LECNGPIVGTPVADTSSRKNATKKLVQEPVKGKRRLKGPATPWVGGVELGVKLNPGVRKRHSKWLGEVGGKGGTSPHRVGRPAKRGWGGGN